MIHDGLSERLAFLRSITSAQLLVGTGPRAFCRAIHVGLSIRALLIMAYSFSQSSGLLDLNMRLLPLRKREFCVGGERIEMSRAVPRRRGTSGVNSSATSGRTPFVDGLGSSGLAIPEDTAFACPMSKASMSPGVTTISHSSGWRLSHVPPSDHEKMHATDFAAPLLVGGTVR